jgi:hypothetical protein
MYYLHVIFKLIRWFNLSYLLNHTCLKKRMYNNDIEINVVQINVSPGKKES